MLRRHGPFEPPNADDTDDTGDMLQNARNHSDAPRRLETSRRLLKTKFSGASRRSIKTFRQTCPREGGSPAR